MQHPIHNYPTSDLILQAVSLTRTFGKAGAAVHALRGASLHIASGRLIALRGRSGSGKTTLLNMLGLLDRPTEGAIYFEGQDVTGLSDKKGMSCVALVLALYFSHLLWFLICRLMRMSNLACVLQAYLRLNVVSTRNKRLILSV